MHGRVFYLKELRYGFEKERFVLRVDCFPEALSELDDPEFRIVFGGMEETNVVVNLDRGRMKEFAIEKGRVCLLNPETIVAAEYRKDIGSSGDAGGAGFARAVANSGWAWRCGTEACPLMCCRPRDIWKCRWGKRIMRGRWWRGRRKRVDKLKVQELKSSGSERKWGTEG